MPKKEIKDLEVLDSKLNKLELRFNKKLESYYSNLEQSALKKVSGYKAGNDIKLTDSLTNGLSNLFRNHFKNVERLSTEYTKKELIDKFSSVDDKEKIRLLKLGRNKNNIIYADKLALKQVQDYQDNLKNILTNAIKDNPKISAKELKELVKHETQSFKNIRVSATSETESNRVANESKLTLYKQMNIRKVRSIAVLDNRTTAICKQLHNRVYIIGSAEQERTAIPRHVRCRSYYVAVV